MTNFNILSGLRILLACLKTTHAIFKGFQIHTSLNLTEQNITFSYV